MEHNQAAMIAESIAAIRPDWLKTSLTTFLKNLPADIQARPLVETHVALLRIAYNRENDTPSKLREPGPWWDAADPTSTESAAPAEVCRTCARPEPACRRAARLTGDPHDYLRTSHQITEGTDR